MANKVGYHNLIIDTATGFGTLATITVYTPNTATKSTIYSTPAGAAQINPFDTDAVGRFSFFADPGEYDIEVSGIGLVTYKLEDVSIIGVFNQFVTSQPTSGEHRLKKLRIDSALQVIVTYDGIAEP